MYMYMYIYILCYYLCFILLFLIGGLPRQHSAGNVSPSSAPPLPPRTRRPTDYSHTPPHRPISKPVYCTCTCTM